MKIKQLELHHLLQNLNMLLKLKEITNINFNIKIVHYNKGSDLKDGNSSFQEKNNFLTLRSTVKKNKI